MESTKSKKRTNTKNGSNTYFHEKYGEEKPRHFFVPKSNADTSWNRCQIIYFAYFRIYW
jgi:type IV secretory pathway VirB9-like protein